MADKESQTPPLVATADTGNPPAKSLAEPPTGERPAEAPVSEQSSVSELKKRGRLPAVLRQGMMPDNRLLESLSARRDTGADFYKRPDRRRPKDTRTISSRETSRRTTRRYFERADAGRKRKWQTYLDRPASNQAIARTKSRPEDSAKAGEPKALEVAPAQRILVGDGPQAFPTVADEIPTVFELPTIGPIPNDANPADAQEPLLEQEEPGPEQPIIRSTRKHIRRSRMPKLRKPRPLRRRPPRRWRELEAVEQ
jgi:hypothetical protein